MMPLWRQIRSGLVEMFYPKTCAGCGMRGTWLCELCTAVIPMLDRGVCDRCGFPMKERCRFCIQLDQSIERARAVYPYMGWVSGATRSLKYHDERGRAADLGGRMCNVARSFDVDMLVPVPLHATKEQQRGYNQSMLLAKEIGREMGIPAEPLLLRTRATQSQVELNSMDRQGNVDGAFTLNPDWLPEPGGRFLLIDDVRTTSATLNECARVLHTTNPASISVLTLALDIPKRELRTWLDSV